MHSMFGGDFSVRIFLACFTQCAGFLTVAFAESDWMAIGGVGLTSFSSGELVSYHIRR